MLKLTLPMASNFDAPAARLIVSKHAYKLNSLEPTITKQNAEEHNSLNEITLRLTLTAQSKR